MGKTRDESGRFKPGQSGNPNGRPKVDISLAALLRDALAELDPATKQTKARALVDALIAAALQGDIKAAGASMGSYRRARATSESRCTRHWGIDCGSHQARPNAEQLSALVNLLSLCVDDPDLFNIPHGYVGRRTGTGKSRCAALLSTIGSRWSTRGNSIGKDYWIGGLVPWWLYTRKDSLCIVTGPSQTLLGSVTWKEIRLRSTAVACRFALASPAASRPARPWSKCRPGWQALGTRTTSVERASGQHAKNLLVIVEEASGVADEIWDAIDSLKYTKLVAIGNPIRAEGRFVDLIRQADTDRNRPSSHTPGRLCDPGIRALNHPMLTWKRSPYGLADQDLARSMLSTLRARLSLGARRTFDARFPRSLFRPAHPSMPGSITRPPSRDRSYRRTTPFTAPAASRSTWAKASAATRPQSL